MSHTGDELIVKRLKGSEIHPFISDIARLRVEIFHDYPYLYAGDLAYEERYLERYLDSEESVLVLVRTASGQVVGASTGMPMEDADEYFQQPLIEQGYDISQIFYFAESVLRADFRGRGIGVRFFEEREAHVQALGRFQWACFCAVVRSPDHPAKPEGYVPLHDFWRHRGYTRYPEIRTAIDWKLVGSTEESPQVMEYWMKYLGDE